MFSSELRNKVLTISIVALVFSSTTFLFSPYHAYLNNILEFNVQFVAMLWFFGQLAAGLFLFLFCIMLLSIKTPFYQKTVSLVLVLSILIWLQGNVLLWDYGKLDGTPLLYEKNFQNGILELLIWGAFLFASIRLSSFIYKKALIVGVVLIVTQVTSLAYERTQLPQDTSWMDYHFDIEREDFNRYSSDKNIVILLLDEFPSFIFQEIIDEEPVYAKYFNGFTFYRNTLGGYPNTLAALTNLFTGEFYKNTVPFYPFMKDAFERNSLPGVLLEGGYQVDARAHYTYFLYPKVFSNWVSNWSPKDLATHGYVLNSLTLFRYSPHFIKKWLTGKRFYTQDLSLGTRERPFLDRGGVPAGAGSDLLDDVFSIVNKLYVDDGTPVFKFYHFMVPHPPYLFNEKLEPGDFQHNRSNFVMYAKGGLNIAKLLIDKLIEKDIYDDTLVFIIGDHGTETNIENAEKYGVKPGAESALKQRALPLMLVKPFNAREKLKISDAPAHLMDVPATVISALGRKEKFPGRSLFNLEESESRDRFYYFYAGDDHLTDRRYMPILFEFKVSGFSWSLASWEHTGRVFQPQGDTFAGPTGKGKLTRITTNKNNFSTIPEYLLIEDPSFFWEVGMGGYPYWLQFEYPSPVEINEYSLKTGIHEGAPEEMPTDWLFQGSEDGNNWVTLDARKAQIKWDKEEEKVYTVAKGNSTFLRSLVNNPNRYKYYRLYFEAGKNRTDVIRIYEINLQ